MEEKKQLPTIEIARLDEHSDMSITSLSPLNREKRMSQILDVPDNESLSSLSSPSLFVRPTWTTSDGASISTKTATTMTTSISSPTLGSSRRASTSSPEKMVFEDYEDGVMNYNRRPFVGVNFCFRCEKRNAQRGVNTLTERVEKTGEKFRDALMIPVYRTVFLCEECVIDIHLLKKNANNASVIVRITSLAMNFF
jgi:hypothetical protein